MQQFPLYFATCDAKAIKISSPSWEKTPLYSGFGDGIEWIEKCCVPLEKVDSGALIFSFKEEISLILK